MVYPFLRGDQIACRSKRNERAIGGSFPLCAAKEANGASDWCERKKSDKGKQFESACTEALK